MIRLTSISQKLTAVLGSASGTVVHFSCSYSDATSTGYAGGTKLNQSNGVTAVDIVLAPAASTIRDVDSIIARNTDSSARVVTIKFEDGLTVNELVSASLAAGSVLSYTHGRGWAVTDSTGAVLTTGGSATVADGDKGDITVSSSGTVWTIDNDVVTYAKMQNVSATDKLLGRSSSGAGDVEEITCTSFARSILDDAAASNARTTLGLGTVATLDSDTDATLAADSNTRVATQSATKAYVDNLITGRSWKNAVRVATTAAGTLSTSFENGDTVDGVTLATGDRILIKNQVAGAENGIYVVAASGAPARSTDADSGAELVNATVMVSEGTTNADTQWTCNTNAPITIGVTSLTFVQIGTGGGGTVTSFSAGDLSPLFTTTETNVTTTPALTFSLNTQTANTFFAGPTSAGPSAPTFRAIAAADFPLFSTFTTADPDYADLLPGYDSSGLANRQFQLDRALGLQPTTPGGRLTLTTGTPVTTSDVVNATTVYYTPYLNDRITLWDGTRWVTGTFTEQSLSLGTLTSGLPYDVFGYLSAGILTLEKLAWTSGTARATAITLQDGRYCKSGDKTRLYLGTFYTTSTTQTEDSAVKRFLWNMYNRVPRHMHVMEATNNWTYATTTTWRSANNSTANRIQFCTGLAEDEITAYVIAIGNAPTGVGQSQGIGLDKTNASDAYATAYYSVCGSCTGVSRWHGTALGFHYLQWVEYTQAGTATWIGNGGSNFQQSSIIGDIWC